MNWEAVIAICSVLALVQVVLVAWVARRQTVTDARTMAQNIKIERLEETLTVKAEVVVDTRFEILSTEFTGVMAQLRTVVEGMEKRLERGDEMFDRQEETQKRLEIESEKRFAHCRGFFATREDVGQLSAALQNLEIKLAKFEERLHSREAR